MNSMILRNVGKMCGENLGKREMMELAQKAVEMERDILTDSFARKHDYLRISLTEKCNLRCTYCMPAEGVTLTPKNSLLTTDEILKLAAYFVGNGVRKIRLTGGEPTVRGDLLYIIESLALLNGCETVAMTSNGLALSNKLESFVKAGLSQLNLSLDTLQKPKFELMTRRKGFDHVMRTIDKAERLLPIVKVNCVVMRGINDDEIVDFIDLTINRRLDVRFIEYMPFNGNKWAMKKMVPYKEMLMKIYEKYENIHRLQDAPNDTSKGFKVDGATGRFGFITSMSNHFCSTCNRLRLTADGNLRVCLHDSAEISLRDVIRSGCSDAELGDVIRAAVLGKKKQHADMEELLQMSHRPMILIGG